jgi:hypothetical protein
MLRIAHQSLIRAFWFFVYSRVDDLAGGLSLEARKRNFQREEIPKITAMFRGCVSAKSHPRRKWRDSCCTSD